MRFMSKTLELNQILDKISLYAKTHTIKDEILNLEPQVNLESIQEELTLVSDMFLLQNRAGIIPLIDDFDIHQLLKYASLDRVYTIKDLLYIRLFLSMEKDVINYYKETIKNKISINSLIKYFDELNNHEHLLSYLNSKMDIDGLILDDATVELSKIRRELSRLDKHLIDKLHKIINDNQSLLNEHVIVLRNNRFCIPVKDTFKNRIKGVIHDYSSSMQTVYIEPESTRQITAEIESLKVMETKEIEKIVALMSEEVFKSEESLKTNLDIFLALDFIQSKARYAKEIDGQMPKINHEKRISLVHAKHPLLDFKTAIPINLELNDKIKALLITGPNTGGKTVALKTVGLLTLMTQCGILIPAHESSEIAIFDQVFADIGDEQSISQSLSTFSSHLTKIIMMIENIKDNTLVLLDELGSGTDPNEGVSLAIAILNEFKKYDIRMMVTTHYSELKSYAYEETNMSTASVAFDKKTLKPLYYLQMGTTGSSHAFLIAKRLGLKDEIVGDALTIFQGRQTDLAKIMEKLNDEMLYLEKQKEKLSQEITLVKKTKEEYNLAKEKLYKEQDEILEKVRVKEETKWNELKNEAKELIMLLQSKKELSNPELADLKFKLNKTNSLSETYRITDDIESGDEVFILPYQQYGIVKSIKNESYQVIFGKFDMQFKKSDLRKEAKKVDPKKVIKREKIETGSTPERKASFEIDLRGFRFDEVKDELDQAIDQALLSGLSSLRIIHGFGSGAVRKAVYDYIKSSSYIKTSRFGGEGEGLNGVTIITLK